MEDWFGDRWHRFIWRRAHGGHPDAAIAIAPLLPALGVSFRAYGGPAAMRVLLGDAISQSVRRHWIERLAGAGQRFDVARFDTACLVLPEQIDWFADAADNRTAAVWLAALAGMSWRQRSAATVPLGGLIDRLQTQHAQWRNTVRLLQQAPGWLAWLQTVVPAMLADRQRHHRPADCAALDALEQGLRRWWLNPLNRATQHAADAAWNAALQMAHEVARDAVTQVARGRLLTRMTTDLRPWPLWILGSVWSATVSPAPSASRQATDADARPRPAPSDAADPASDPPLHKQARAVEPETGPAPLILPFRAESLLSWGEYTRVDRAHDEDEDPDAATALRAIEELAIQVGERQSPSVPLTRLRVDFDLPAAASDDPCTGVSYTLPEWHLTEQALQPGRVQVIEHLPRDARPLDLPAHLHEAVDRVKRRFGVLAVHQAVRRGCDQGDNLDLDAVVAHRLSADGPVREASPRVYLGRRAPQREVLCQVMADVSLSTAAHASDTQTVIEVLQESLLVLGSALQAAGDPFALHAFSSVRRSGVRVMPLKPFDAAFDRQAIGHVLALRPGYYSRLGAGLRAAARSLQTAATGRQSSASTRRLILLITDGKPHDIDHYDGRFGIEDTRQAMLACRRAGLTPLCVAIDREHGPAANTLDHLFGRQGWIGIERVSELPERLPRLYQSLRCG